VLAPGDEAGDVLCANRCERRSFTAAARTSGQSSRPRWRVAATSSRIRGRGRGQTAAVDLDHGGSADGPATVHRARCPGLAGPARPRADRPGTVDQQHCGPLTLSRRRTMLPGSRTLIGEAIRVEDRRERVARPLVTSSRTDRGSWWRSGGHWDRLGEPPWPSRWPRVCSRVPTSPLMPTRTGPASPRPLVHRRRPASCPPRLSDQGSLDLAPSRVSPR
jgi:hypothetical protein